eukprot:2558430-Rhodomonas_salina.2
MHASYHLHPEPVRPRLVSPYVQALRTIPPPQHLSSTSLPQGSRHSCTQNPLAFPYTQAIEASPTVVGPPAPVDLSTQTVLPASESSAHGIGAAAQIANPHAHPPKGQKRRDRQRISWTGFKAKQPVGANGTRSSHQCNKKQHSSKKSAGKQLRQTAPHLAHVPSHQHHGHTTRRREGQGGHLIHNAEVGAGVEGGGVVLDARAVDLQQPVHLPQPCTALSQTRLAPRSRTLSHSLALSRTLSHPPRTLSHPPRTSHSDAQTLCPPSPASP